MTNNELQMQDGTTPLPRCDDPTSVNKFLKEHMPALMNTIECTDTKGSPIISLKGESATDWRFKSIALKKALMDPAYKRQALEEILSDLIVAAYQDRLALMSVGPTVNHEADVGLLQSIQKLRHLADGHIMKILKLVNDIEQPKTNIAVNKPQQVNIGDKQVNISHNTTSDNVRNP